MSGHDRLEGEIAGSATGVFGTLPKGPVKDEAEPVRLMPVAKAVVPGTMPVSVKAEPANFASSGGFTQLLRALNFDQVKESAIEAEEEMPEKPLVSAQVTSFRPQSAPVAAKFEVAPVQPAPVPFAAAQSEPASVAAVVPAAAAMPYEAASFTQLFKKLDAEPLVEPATEVSVSKIETAVAAKPGMFTRLFAMPVQETELESEVVSTASAAEVAPRSGPSTQLFAEVPRRAAEPVEFVAESRPVVLVAPESLPPASTPVQLAPTPAEGSFTQMFQALGTPVREPAVRDEPTSIASAAPPQASSFTQMFQALGEAPAAVAKRQPESAGKPQSFTQMFGTLTASPVASSAPGSYDKPFTTDAPGHEAAPRYPAYDESPQEARTPLFSPAEAVPTGRPPIGNMAAQGGITQLLQRLDQPSRAAQPFTTQEYPSPVAGAGSAQPGSYASVYGDGGALAASTPLAAAQAGTAGPSEFTRIINASAMREGAMRGGGGAPAAAAETHGAGSSSAGGGMSLPGGLPHASFSGPGGAHASVSASGSPHASFSAPSAPHASFSGPGGAHASLSASGGPHGSISGPHVPALSQVRLPHGPKGSATGMQKYLPLLLILVIILLLAVLVAVIVLMKK